MQFCNTVLIKTCIHYVQKEMLIAKQENKVNNNLNDNIAERLLILRI